MRRAALLALTAVLGLSAIAPQAAAQTVADRADARCVLVLYVVARDPKTRESAVRGTYYYLGRLDARGMGAKLDTLMLAEGKAINGQPIQAELSRCGAELNTRSGALQAAYQRLQAQAAATAPKPAAPTPK